MSNSSDPENGKVFTTVRMASRDLPLSRTDGRTNVRLDTRHFHFLVHSHARPKLCKYMCIYMCMYLWCVLLKPSVGRGDDQDAAGKNQLCQTIIELHWIRKTTNEVASEYTTKLTQFWKTTCITHGEANSCTVLFDV